MNLRNVFGIVVAAHAAVFTVIFATPGCRSGAKSKPRPEDTAIASADPIAAPAGSVAGTPVESMSYDALNAGSPAASPSSVSPVAAVTPVTPAASGYTDEGGVVRFAPSRPSTAISPVASTPAPTSSSATHTVGKGDNLWAIAKKYGITVGELAAANQLAPSATLRLGQQLSVPSRAAAETAAGSSASEAVNTYAVKSGDTLGAIARKQGTTVAALRAANNLSGDNLRVGQKLVIPGNATPLSSSSSSAPSASSAAAPQAGSGSYTIVPGDTLGSIAQRHGVKSGDLAVLNNITDPKKLRVGQVIKLPTGARASSSAASSTPAYSPTPSYSPTPVESEPTSISPVTPLEPVTPVEPDAVPVTPIFN
ncbi:MAG: LysM peptidoglycan-binding domain-containing protein [Burkholderiales bacterium]|nr:LysM peptidoglycan-binding domain-containing protein [Opitutaceae bacterium]